MSVKTIIVKFICQLCNKNQLEGRDQFTLKVISNILSCILSIEFLIKLKKTLLNCSLSEFKSISDLLVLKSIIILLSNSFIKLMTIFHVKELNHYL